MFKNFQQKLFPLLIAFSALSVSASAAFYSISGLSKLFAGAAFAVIIMAASLEIAKLVIASLLYQYRKGLPKFLKYYLSIACIVLILITSMGIYGFLSAAYQETAAKAGTIDAQIALVEVKRDNVKGQLLVYNEEKSSINKAVASLRNGLSTNKIQYTDTLGNVITTTSSSTRRALEKQLDQAIERQTIINSKVDDLNEDLFEYETEIVEIKTSDAITSELGPLKYLSGLTGIPMDRIINYLLLTIIFVFDPLAIALVVAANFAFDQIRPKIKENLYGEKVIYDHDQTTYDYNQTTYDGEESSDMYQHANDSSTEEDRGLPEGYSEEIEETEEEKLERENNEKLAKENKILNTSSVSGWRKNKIIKERRAKDNNEDDDLVIRY
tara:strand:+ start:889 stop:2037 length:1149 start_codon:yes stop_codon:yes gene_type:complete